MKDSVKLVEYFLYLPGSLSAIPQTPAVGRVADLAYAQYKTCSVENMLTRKHAQRKTCSMENMLSGKHAQYQYKICSIENILDTKYVDKNMQVSKYAFKIREILTNFHVTGKRGLDHGGNGPTGKG